MSAESMEFNRLFQSKLEEIETLKARNKELEDVGTALYEELTLERSGYMHGARTKELQKLNHEKDNQIAGLELCNENLENRVNELDELKDNDGFIMVYDAIENVDTVSILTTLDKCPKCGGEADNGHDRCMPPNAYHCTKCETTFRECD